MSHKTLTLAELREISRRVIQNGGANRKEVLLSNKEDIVDKVRRESIEIMRRLRIFY